MAVRLGDEKKRDGGKLPWYLLPWNAVQEVVKVYQFGAGIYGENSWQTIEDPRERYFSATIRHLTAWWEGEKLDPESGLNHLAHAAWNILALLWFDLTAHKRRSAQPMTLVVCSSCKHECGAEMASTTVISDCCKAPVLFYMKKSYTNS